MRMLISGWIVVILSFGMFTLAVVDYSKFQRFFGFMGYWRFLWYQLPLSKLSTFHCLAMCLVFGFGMVTQESIPSVAPFLIKLLVVQLVCAIPMLLRDYMFQQASRDK
jgi:ABC-type spermidine/putrescine transport system permease subunit I